MKKRLLYSLLISCFASSILSAQTLQHGIGIHFAGIDLYGSQTGNYLLNDRVNKSDGKIQKKLFWDPAIRVSYWQAVHSHINLQFGATVSNLQYPISDKDSSFIRTKLGTNTIKKELPFLGLDAKINVSLLPKETYIASPYVSLGAGATLRETEQGMDIPVGLGCNFHLSKNIFLNVESNYQVALSKIDQSHITHSIGMVYWWGNKQKTKVEVAPTKPLIRDRDNDGIADKDDDCPTLPGRKETKGCPDKDKDGIPDREDQCPDMAGPKALHGCPDTDGDGIPDNIDKCPKIAGISKYEGCPIPDSDRDGFNDEVDKCPTVASSINNGCPEIKQEVIEKISKAAKGINFETNSAVINKSSYADLDNIVSMLNSEPTYRVDIAGHTDNVGTPENNLTLSQQRADACKAYLIEKGIAASRISSVGYGDTKPIADNSSEEGRAKNRRTEFTLKN